MIKLTGAALDQAVANVLGIKSVHNCEKWVELTDEEISELSKGHIVRSTYARAIEAKLKLKNGYAEEKNT